MKNVEIYVTGSYSRDTDLGYWTYYIHYKGAVKKRTGCIPLNAQSSNRMILVAMIEALKSFNEPCNLLIKTKTYIGFIHKQKSKNLDLIERFEREAIKAGHRYMIEEKSDFTIVKQWEDSYGKM